ncbi:AAA family ATPase [Streptomyces sp. NPDC048436]|uniref:helix-turn-helix transcriptional regulator n=1 Tax=Streptomyces sp. NPDC048436 TaxID=3365550 RepID=UPI0037109DC9
MNLVDRGEEFSIMDGMLEASMAGHGGVLLVSGAVASGKTALLRAFGERATAAGALTLQATASEAESDLPLGVMGQLLLGADLSGADVKRAAHLVDLMAVAAQIRRAEGVLPAVVMNEIPKLCGIVLEQSRERPVVLSIDDVHHADGHSLECVLYLARRLDASRILVVLGENSGFLAGNTRLHVDLLRLPGCRNIRLGPLERHGVAEMISGFGEPGWGTRQLVSELHRTGGGNPLLTRALIEDHRASRALPEDHLASGGRNGSAGLVPGEAFAQAVSTGLYRSDLSTRRTAWALAVVGQDVPLAELVEILGTSREAVHRSLRALNDAGLLDSGWFRHEAGRSAALRSMEPAHRARLEARVAQVLHEHGEAATVVVQHLIAAEPIDAPWALSTLLEAADRALADDEVALALTCLRAARDTCTDAQQSVAIRAALTRAGWRVNPATAARHLPELTAAALDGSLGSRQTVELVGHLLWFGHMDAALEVLADAEQRAEQNAGQNPEQKGAHTAIAGQPEPEASLRLDCVRSWMAYEYPGLPGSVDARHGDVERCAKTPARSPHHRAATLMKAVLGGADEDVVVRAEQILQSTRLDDGTLTALVVALNSLVLADRLDTAALWCETLAKEATERRAPMWQALLSAVKARVELRLGGLAAAEESARLALALVPPEGWGAAIASPVATSVYAKTAMGRLDEAAAQLGVPIPETALRTPDGLLYLRARGQHYLAAGRPYAALDDFHACGDLMTRWEFDLPALIPWRTDAAEAHLLLGDDDRARTLAREQLALTEGESAGHAWTRGVSLRVLASALHPGRRLPLLGEAIDILRERGHRVELARATDELARAHRELGNGGQARALARKAQQLGRECGVPVLRASPPVDSGNTLTDEQPWPSKARRKTAELSDAELRVATLAAHDYTNRQIADKLFITVSTVEQHLTRAYRKLAVQRRADLAAKLSPVPVPVVGSGRRQVHREGHRERHEDGDECDRLRVV